MGSKPENKFYNYLSSISKEEYDGIYEGMKNIFGTPHRRTIALKSPQLITHAELIEIAELIGTSGWTLYNIYEVGKEVVTDKEAEQLLLVHTTTMPVPA